jgi:hypothetical protein
MSRIALVLAAMMVSSIAAGGTVTGRVSYVRVDNSGRGFIYFDQNVASSAACTQASYENAMAFDTGTVGGKAILARALAAKAAGDVVSVAGTGTCAIYGSWAEDVLYFDFEPQ